jgi:ATP-dependent DNA helicase RecG
VIVDEQQRFGVAQRQALLDKQQQANQPTPHFLSLTATPIPRTLALFMTGELDISVIKGRPPGRLPIATEVIGPKQRSVIDRAIESTVTKLEQIYVITPLIEESDSLGVRAATVEYERLKKQWPKLRLGLVHGSMPADDRIGVLDKFRRSELDLVVSTTVIEVGIDVPNATLMIIEGAERFGLAQLHQLRGRVGRSDKPSRCLLVTDQSTASVKQRLTKVATIDDGLALAEQDLQARGAGDLYGVRQSGLPDWKLASLQDGELMTTARTIAQELLTKYPDWLKSPNAAELQKLTASWHRE